MIVDSALYRDGVRVRVDCHKDDLSAVRDEATGKGDFVWVGLHEPDGSELEQVADIFSLHPLAVEDAIKAHQRPKLERYDDGLFMVLKTLWYVDEDDAVETGEINLFVGENYIVSVRHGKGAELHSARLDLEEQQAVLGHGPSAVVYAICDRVVDAYENVASSLEEDVDEVEASVFSPDRTSDSQRIYVLKRELSEMRRAVTPLRNPMSRFADGSVPMITQEAAPFFRDVADHVVRVSETIESLDGLLSTAFDAHLAQHQRPAERGHAEDLRVGRDRRDRHAGRRRLRHELQQHAGAALALRLLLRAHLDGERLGVRVPPVQEVRLALTQVTWAS